MPTVTHGGYLGIVPRFIDGTNIFSAAPASIKIGQRVADSYDDATGEITMPKFRLIDGSHA